MTYFRMLLLCGQLALRSVMADCDWTMTSRGFKFVGTDPMKGK